MLLNSFGKNIGFSGIFYLGDSPLSLLVLSIKDHYQANPNFENNNDKLNELLLNLDGSLVDEQQMVFIRRNLRIYQQDKIFIIKPSQRKYWTYSASCRDADEIFKDVSNAWR